MRKNQPNRLHDRFLDLGIKKTCKLARGTLANNAQLTLQHLLGEIIFVILEIKEVPLERRRTRFIRWIMVCLFISLGFGHHERTYS